MTFCNWILEVKTAIVTALPYKTILIRMGIHKSRNSYEFLFSFVRCCLQTFQTIEQSQQPAKNPYQLPKNFKCKDNSQDGEILWVGWVKRDKYLSKGTKSKKKDMQSVYLKMSSPNPHLTHMRSGRIMSQQTHCSRISEKKKTTTANANAPRFVLIEIVQTSFFLFTFVEKCFSRVAQGLGAAHYIHTLPHA